MLRSLHLQTVALTDKCSCRCMAGAVESDFYVAYTVQGSLVLI